MRAENTGKHLSTYPVFLYSCSQRLGAEDSIFLVNFCPEAAALLVGFQLLFLSR